MKIVLQHPGVWPAIDDSSFVDEEMHQGADYHYLPVRARRVMMSIMEFNTAREAWDYIRTSRTSKDLLADAARIQSTMRRFECLVMQAGATVTGFLHRLNALVKKIHTLAGK